MNLDGGTYMKYIQFTKKENEIMDILWKHDIAMSANDIKLASKNLVSIRFSKRYKNYWR